MAKYRLIKNTNHKVGKYGYYYARKVADKTVELDDLVQHMAGHNTAYSAGVIKGVLEDAVTCIRELAYEGKSVKIANLGIFSVGLKSMAVQDASKFNAGSGIKSLWKVRGTGEVKNALIGLTRAAGAAITWEEDNEYTSPRNAAAAGGE